VLQGSPLPTHISIIDAHVLMSVQVRGALPESLRCLRTAMRALDRILSTSSTSPTSTSTSSSSSNKEDVRMVENILMLFLRNVRRCRVKFSFYEIRSTDGSTIDESESPVAWVGSLENVVRVLGIDRLRALEGIRQRLFLTHFTVLYCIVLYCIVLYCTVL
jgi:hypothetical protein